MQRADVWYVPDAPTDAQRSLPGLLARMAIGPSLFEPFHQSPDVDEVLDCLRKLLTLQRSAKGRERWRARPDHPPTMWTLSAGRPDTAIQALGMTRLGGWPAGIYTPADALRARIVVIPELPRTRATLLVRLMGAGHVLRDAIEALRRLPADASERGVVIPTPRILTLEVPVATHASRIAMHRSRRATRHSRVATPPSRSAPHGSRIAAPDPRIATRGSERNTPGTPSCAHTLGLLCALRALLRWTPGRQSAIAAQQRSKLGELPATRAFTSAIRALQSALCR